MDQPHANTYVEFDDDWEMMDRGYCCFCISRGKTYRKRRMSIEHQRMKENVLGDRIDSIVRKQDKKDVGAIFDVQRQQIELESLTDTKEEGGSTEETFHYYLIFLLYQYV